MQSCKKCWGAAIFCGNNITSIKTALFCSGYNTAIGLSDSATWIRNMCEIVSRCHTNT